MHADRAKHFLLTRREERSSPYRSPNSERQKRTRVISVSPCDVFYLGDKCIRMSHHARKVAIGRRTELFREMIIDVNRTDVSMDTPEQIGFGGRKEELA